MPVARIAGSPLLPGTTPIEIFYRDLGDPSGLPLLVLHGGCFIAQGDPAEVIKSQPVREVYMGIPADA